MPKLPDNRNKMNDELLIMILIWIIAACIAGGMASRYVWHNTRPAQPQRVSLPYVSPEPSVMPVKTKEIPVKDETIARVIEVLCMIESGGKHDAIGDGGRAVGVLQIWPIMVREASRISGIPFSLVDRFNSAKSREMAWHVLSYYQKKRKVEDPVQLAGLWNRPDGKAPARYLHKFEQEWYKQEAGR